MEQQLGTSLETLLNLITEFTGTTDFDKGLIYFSESLK